ncbi:MAG: hypothetical protein EH225_09060 [Calditrichaeota bacterium]|nr:MAG: hypothetical protein EH225_09060 [Calditrichota bacterium]
MKSKIFPYTIIILLIYNLLFLHGQEMPHQKMEMDCQECHSPENWQIIDFNHNNTKFPLEANHKNLQCQKCHDIHYFGDISMECRNCHRDVHQSRLGPWCQACHTPQGWTVIDHSNAHANTTFPLLGAHARLDCGACHYTEIEGVFSPLISDCYSCHESDYRSVQSPNHVTSGFSKECTMCHSFFTWIPAEFTQHESLFPIFSGNHAGEWNQCSDCHISPGNFDIFSCLNCHEHRRDRMDDEHREVPGYGYDSQLCYSCHPEGTEGDIDD